MPVNISRAGQWSFEKAAPAAGESSAAASSSSQQLQATVKQGIEMAAANFGQIATANVFTAEIDGGATTLRFGEGVRGEKPPSGSSEEAANRAGSGKSGNEPTPDPVLWAAIRMRTKTLW